MGYAAKLGSSSSIKYEIISTEDYQYSGGYYGSRTFNNLDMDGYYILSCCGGTPNNNWNMGITVSDINCITSNSHTTGAFFYLFTLKEPQLVINITVGSSANPKHCYINLVRFYS